MPSERKARIMEIELRLRYPTQIDTPSLYYGVGICFAFR